MVEDNTKNQKRQVAYKVKIKDLLSGTYVKEEGWNPNYLVLEEGKQVSRINIIGTVIDKPIDSGIGYQIAVVDDGSGKIGLRAFDVNSPINALNVGDMVLIIGRLREFGSERYIVPEIIKKVNDGGWVELRKLELNKNTKPNDNNVEVYDVGEEPISSDNGIISLIKNLDKGDGADLSEVVEKSGEKDAEKIINNMIKVGELFEIKPGKIKILE